MEKYAVIDWIIDEGQFTDPLTSLYKTRKAARKAKKSMKRFVDVAKVFKLVEVR